MVVGAVVMTPPSGRRVRELGFRHWQPPAGRPAKACQRPGSFQTTGGQSVDPLHGPLLGGLIMGMLGFCATSRLLCLLAHIDISNPLLRCNLVQVLILEHCFHTEFALLISQPAPVRPDRKSTRLNSSHVKI